METLLMKFHSEQETFDPTFSYILPFNNRLGADNTYEMSVKDGKPVYLRTEESYKQGIAAMHDAYKKGLIDPGTLH